MVVRQRLLLEAVLVVGGLGCIALAGHSYLRFHSFQSQAERVGSTSTAGQQSSGAKALPHPVIGLLKIQRLGFTMAMVEGDDDEALELAAGHMPGSAMAGERGNMIVAGHRDSAFWPLRRLRRGDRIQVEMTKVEMTKVELTKKAMYRVESLDIVQPENNAALVDTTEPVLTLVTCYPFRHVGPAPQRFVVRASLVR